MHHASPQQQPGDDHNLGKASLPSRGIDKRITVRMHMIQGTPQETPQPQKRSYETEAIQLLTWAVASRASDLHLVVGQPPVLRMHGNLVEAEGYPRLSVEDMSGLVKCFFAMKGSEGDRLEAEQLKVKGAADFAVGLKVTYDEPGKGVVEEPARFRVNIATANEGLMLTARHIPSKIKSLNDLNVPEQVANLINRQRGLVLVVGPTGSGKSTTLASMVDHINANRTDKKILTIEDPIEFVHKHKQSLIQQREVGAHVPSFAEGIKQSLRQNPDVILVGEMRDRDDMHAALTAAETGHLVFATLHTTGASMTVERFVGQFPDTEQDAVKTKLSMYLVAVVSQLLVPNIDGDGRVAIFEVMVNTPAVAERIRKDPKNLANEIQLGANHGMLSFDNCLLERYKSGLITSETVLEKCYDLKTVQQRMRDFDIGH